MLRLAGRTLLTALLLLAFGSPTLLAQEALSPRLQIGASLLPTVIAANQRLANDVAEPLPIYLVYDNNRRLAERLRPRLEKIGKIRNRELKVESIALTDLAATSPAPGAAIFITESLGGRLDKLLDFARQRKVLLFSPYEGDVELGVATGFRVTDKVLPMVNMTALQQSNIQLKAFFLRIAVKHE